MPKTELPRLDSPRFKANPYPVYARLRTEAPVYRAKVAFWLPAIWIVTRYEDVVRVLKDQRFSKDYVQKFPWMPRSTRTMYRNLLTIDPPDHTRLRSLVQKAFTPRLIEGLRDRIQRVCDELLDRAASSDTIELIDAYALPVPLTIISDLLGIPIQDRRRFGPWAKRMAASGPSVALSDFLRALPAVASLARYVRGLVTLRRSAPQDGSVTIPRGELVVVSLGSANHDESQFPDPEIFDVAREPNKHLAFGMGAHFCLGAPLARLEGEIALTTLFRRFPGLHLAVPPDSLRWRRSLALRGLVELPVRLN